MKLITIIFILLFSSFSFAQNTEYKEYFDNGTLKISGYKNSNGQKEEQWKEYYKSGKLQFIRFFKDGKLEGERQQYYEDGKLRSIGKF